MLYLFGERTHADDRPGSSVSMDTAPFANTIQVVTVTPTFPPSKCSHKLMFEICSSKCAHLQSRNRAYWNDLKRTEHDWLSNVFPYCVPMAQCSILFCWQEDEVDLLLYKEDGRIERKRDEQLCHHGPSGKCLHCVPLEVVEFSFLKS